MLRTATERRPHHRILAAITLSLTAAVGTAVFAFFSDQRPAKKSDTPPRITVSRETTFLTGPLRKDGTVDYVRALNDRYSKGVTPENNAAVACLKALGPSAIPAVDRPTLYAALRMKPLPETGPYFVSLSAFAKTLKSVHIVKLYDDIDDCMARPWKRAQYPEIAKWLDANEEPLDALRAASGRSKYFLPIAREERIRPFGWPGEFRQTFYYRLKFGARLLAAHAFLGIGEGRYREALDDLLACRRLSRLVERDLSAAITRCANLDVYPHKPELHVSHSGKLSAKQALAYRRELDELGPFSRARERLHLLGRYSLLDAACRWSRHADPNHALLELFPPTDGKKTGAGIDRRAIAERDKLRNAIRNAPSLHEIVDWNLVLAEINARHDAALKAPDPGDLRKRKAAFVPLSQRRRQTRTRLLKVLQLKNFKPADRKEASLCIAEVIEHHWMMWPAQLTSSQARANVRYHLNRLAFALAAHRAEKGAYPDALEKLAPKYIGELPDDPHSAKAFRYVVGKDGGYLLYTVGPNGRDDGGRWSYDSVTMKYEDDIAVRSPPVVDAK